MASPPVSPPALSSPLSRSVGEGAGGESDSTPYPLHPIPYTLREGPGGGPLPSRTEERQARLNQFANLVLENRLDQLAAVGLAPQQRLGEVLRLLQADLGRHRRLVWVYDDFHDGRPAGSNRLLQRWPNLLGLFHGQAQPAARLRVLGKINRMQVYAVFRIAEKDDLLPLDLAEHIVLDDNYQDRQVVLDCGGELAHQHRKAAIADEGDRLPIRVGQRGGDSVRQARRHRRQRARTTKLLRAAHLEVAGDPGGDRARIGGDDGIVGGQLGQLPGDALRLDGHIIAHGPFFHQLPPLLHALLELFQEAAILLALHQSAKRSDRGLGIPYQTDIYREAQANAVGLIVYLDAFSLARLRQKLHIGERRADDEQRVAALHGILRGRRAQQPDPAGRQRMVVGNNALA